MVMACYVSHNTFHHLFRPAQTRPQGACGSCLEIECTGPRCNKNVTTLPVVITDSCNWDCNATNINMHVFAFEQLAPLKYGRTTVRYRCFAWLPAASCWWLSIPISHKAPA